MRALWNFLIESFRVPVAVTPPQAMRRGVIALLALLLASPAAGQSSLTVTERVTLEPSQVVALTFTDVRVTLTGGKPLNSNYQLNASGCGHWASGSEMLPLVTDSQGRAVNDASFFAYQPDSAGENCTVQVEFEKSRAVANTNLFISTQYESAGGRAGSQAGSVGALVGGSESGGRRRRPR